MVVEFAPTSMVEFLPAIEGETVVRRIPLFFLGALPYIVGMCTAWYWVPLVEQPATWGLLLIVHATAFCMVASGDELFDG